MGARVHDNIAERATTAVAGVGLTFPSWWYHFEATSNFFALLIPILSAVWLIVQIVRVIVKEERK